jgi:hypothetical protein
MFGSSGHMRRPSQRHRARYPFPSLRHPVYPFLSPFKEPTHSWFGYSLDSSNILSGEFHLQLSCPTSCMGSVSCALAAASLSSLRGVRSKGKEKATLTCTLVPPVPIPFHSALAQRVCRRTVCPVPSLTTSHGPQIWS